jgi:LysM repeat protein
VFNPTAASCAVPAGWVAYRVVAGDTLGTIAERVGSSVVALQNANCIANSEIIYVGQILYVPALPAGVPTAVINPTIRATQAVTCPVPSGWQAYIVQAGDTLGTIATRFNTTTAVLQAGNCLTNVDRIFAGQLLYVPAASIVATATATPVRATTVTATTSSPIGNLPILAQTFVTVRPTVPRQDGALVTLQDTVALDIGVVQDADRVRYYAGDRQNDPNRVQIGVDNDPFDGTQITYVFNSFDPELYFFAAAENEFGSVSTQWVRVVYDPTFLVGTGKPDIFPFMGFDGAIYTLEPRRAVTISWTGAPTNAARIEFHLVQASTGDTVINIDTTPADGARVLWQVPALLRGQVFARAVFSNGSTSDSDPVNVYSEN